MASMNNDSYQIIQMTVLCVPQLKRRLVSPQGIETQEGNPVFFGVCGRRNGVNTYCWIEVRPNKEVWWKYAPYQASDDHDQAS